MKINNIEALEISERDSLPTDREIKVSWTGKWPCYCSGEWVITIGGEKVDLPKKVRTSPMGTYGTYSAWSFNSNWEEEWRNYEDGLTFEPWLQANSWVSRLGLSETEKQALFDAISEKDWRYGSCGGCI